MIRFSTPAVSVTATGGQYDVLCEATPAGERRTLLATVCNAAEGAAMVDFKVQLKSHEDAPWVDYLGAADFDAAGNVDFASNAGPHELPPGATAMVRVDVAAAHAVRMSGKVGAGAAEVSVYGTIA